MLEVLRTELLNLKATADVVGFTCDGVGASVGSHGPLDGATDERRHSVDLEASDRFCLGAPLKGDGILRHSGHAELARCTNAWNMGRTSAVRYMVKPSVSC